MVDLNNFDVLRESQPYFIYQRILLNSPIVYFLFSLDYGFYYLLRQIHIRYPSDNGIVQYPNLNIFAVQKGSGKETQNVPIPATLFCTPGNSNVTMVGALSTVGEVKAAKLQNIVYPFRDTMEFQISGHGIATPPFVDMCLIGYYLPVKENMMWSKDNGSN
ncbi:MAG: hypothetical protein WC390_11905 [Sulfurimonas sp.]|jgi:hypothetical protein